MWLSVIALLYWILAPTICWDGTRPVRLDVRTYDAITGAPIANATVLLWDANGLGQRLNPSPVTTDPRGRAELRGMFGAGGNKGLLWNSASFSGRGHEVQVTAPGYVWVSVPVAGKNYISTWFFDTGARLTMKVPMQRAPTTAPAGWQ